MTTIVPYIGLQEGPQDDARVILVSVETTQGFSVIEDTSYPEYSAVRTPMGVFYSKASPLQVMDTISEVRMKAGLESSVRRHELEVQASVAGRYGAPADSPGDQVEDKDA